jgi:hypothetical protein
VTQDQLARQAIGVRYLVLFPDSQPRACPAGKPHWPATGALPPLPYRTLDQRVRPAAAWNHLDEQYVARRNVRDLPSTIESLTERLANLTADEATATQHGADPITIGKHALAREDVPSVLASKLDSLPVGVRDTTRAPIGTYRGLRFGLVLHPQFPPDVYLEGAITRQSTLSRDHQGPRAVLNALERLATGYGSECVRVRQDLAIAQSQLRDYQARWASLSRTTSTCPN